MAAAAARKLQKEIDITLKKVEEQRQEFDDVWDEAMNAAGSHREKLGEELKKSINKLQRSRVQIREWIAAEKTEQKTMDRLEESRRRIETDMQRFKEFEREIKTKAFSTQALSKEEDMDVLSVEKKQNYEWLINQLHQLQEFIDEVEAEVESCTKKEEGKRATLVQVEERHKWHIEKLERLLRLLQNDEVDMSELAVLKDIVEDYMDRHKCPEYYHDDTLYDVFFTAEEAVVPEETTPTAAVVASQKSGDFDAASKDGTKKESIVEHKKDEKTPTGKESKKTKDRKKKTEKADSKVVSVRMSDATTDKGDKKYGSRSELLASESGEKKISEVKIQEDQLIGEAEEFICKICYVHVVGNGPFLTNCSHLFCGDCLNEWFQTHPECQSWAQRAKSAGPQRIVPCPVCKQNLNEKTDLYPVCSTSMRSENLLLWRMLSSLKIMCKNHPKVCTEGKCDWIGEYGTYQTHIQGCENRPVADQISRDKGQGIRTLNSSVTNTSNSQQLLLPNARVTVGTSANEASARTSASSSSLPHTDIKNTAKASNVKPVILAGCEAKSSSTAPKASQPNVPIENTSSNHTRQPTNQAKLDPMLPTNNGLVDKSADNDIGTKQVLGAPQPARTAQESQKATQAANVSGAATVTSAGDISSSSQTPEKDLYRSVQVFAPNGKGQIAVNEGDVVEILQRHDSGWSYGKNHSLPEGEPSEGWFPSWIAGARIQKDDAATNAEQRQNEASAARVPNGKADGIIRDSQQTRDITAQEAKAQTTSPSRCLVHQPFTATDVAQLSLVKGDYVDIIERHPTGWTFGRHVSTQKEGWFPDWVSSTH